MKTTLWKNWSFQAKTVYTVFFINLPVAKLMHDTAYLAVSYWKTVHDYWGTRDGSILSVHRSDGFDMLLELPLSGRRLLRRGRSIQNMLSSEELFIVVEAENKFWERPNRPNTWPRSTVRSLLLLRDAKPSATLHTVSSCRQDMLLE